MELPRILITAGSSGTGKTLITSGLLQALLFRGLSPASFKCGPDYIDPMFHSQVLGTKSRNLDTFFTDPDTTRYLLAKNLSGCDIAVMEGVMGYYDGLGGISPKASAYDLARVTDTPSILIVNARGMSLSLAALIKGFSTFRPDSRIRGVILNRLSPSLYDRFRTTIEEETQVKVLGYVPQTDDAVLESRHLGLVLPGEIPRLQKRLEDFARILEKTLDLDGILRMASDTPPLRVTPDRAEFSQKPFSQDGPLRIGLAEDEAFCFFYEDNLSLLRQMGAELVSFSPIHDNSLPENLDGLLLYGGYPELHAASLAENEGMRSAIRQALRGGMPCLAECGGFMYLHQEMEGMDGIFYPMAGVIEGKVFRTPRLSRFGYITLQQKVPAFSENAWGEIRAHEFHYFDSTNCGSSFTACKPLSERSWDCMHASETMLAGFPHLYYYANPQVPRAFLRACGEYAKGGK
ncbi:MAG: cobyrinate a,c-diamide synthase [Blautia sp.]|nr:cobyrinate a,c-diamide synthase [Blautia sp.]